MLNQIETVETGSFSMDCFRFGNGGEALVILPGLSVQSVMGFTDMIAASYGLLASRFAVYVFDRRKDPPDPYPVREMAHDTLMAFRAIGLDRVCLFGASQGGMIALQLAIANPNLVEKLVLGSTAAQVTEERYKVVEQWAALADRGDATGLYLAFGEAVYPPDMFEQSRVQLAEAAKTVTDDELRRFSILARGTRGFDVAERLGDIACPVLAIGSSDDRVLGADATLQIARILDGRSGFELHMYDGYGHAAYDTAPDYKKRMLQFLIA